MWEWKSWRQTGTERCRGVIEEDERLAKRLLIIL
jgi:hypothetical protein